MMGEIERVFGQASLIIKHKMESRSISFFPVADSR